MQSKSSIYLLRNGIGKGKRLRKNEENRILQERCGVLQKHVKNGLAK